MTPSQISKNVARAIELDRQIAQNKEELDTIKERLVAEAESRPDELAETEGGGQTITFEADTGEIARVTFPAPSLKSTIDAEKPAGAKLMAKVGKWKDELFKPALRYALVENFRDRVKEIFGGAEARRIIAACETKSPARVAFETKPAVETREAA